MDNFSSIDQQLAIWIDAHTDDLVQAAQGLIQIPSVKGEPAPNAPYGAETANALEYALGVAERHGLTIRNLEGHAGHAEWRAGHVAPDAEIVGVLAHVDVVPEGDGWRHPPFGAEIEDGVLFGRGAVDDKGPAIAGLFAILAVAGCDVPVAKRVRLILGADEESGFGCVAHYFANEEMPATGFTPDGRFPVIYAEKGIANLEVEFNGSISAGGMSIARLTAGRRSNMVPDFAEAIFLGQPDDIDKLATLVASSDTLEITAREAWQLTIAARGVSAHGSTPNEGVNAVVVLIRGLRKAGYEVSPALVRMYEWAEDTTGGTLGIAGRDEVVTELTSNLGVVDYQNGRLSLIFNVRYPVTWTAEQVVEKSRPAVEAAGGAVSLQAYNAPLYVPADDPLIKTLLEVYRSETGDEAAPLAMGGGTYARVMRKGVAFGPEFPGSPGGAHQPDEHWPVADLVRATKIYARAIARLANQ